MIFNEDMLNSEDGMFPVREEAEMLNFSNRERFPISSGIIPAFLEVERYHERMPFNTTVWI